MNNSSNCSSDSGWQRLNPVDLALIVVTPSLVAFGVAANSINIVVLTRRWMASSTNNYLTALAVADTAYLVVFYIITVKFYPGVLSNQWFAHALSYLFPVANLLSNYATWLTCLFTFERWLVIYKPMLGRRHCTKERAKHLICGLFAATALFTLPNFFEYQAVSKVTDCGNFTQTLWGIGKTDAYNLTKSLGYYQVFVSIFVFGPLLFLVVFNSLLIRSVVLARRRRIAMGHGCGEEAPDGRSIPMLHQPSPTGQQQQQQKQRRAHKSANEQQKVTVMLIAVVLLFCLCQLPSAAVTLRKAMQSDEADASGSRTLASRLLNSLVNILLLLNAACNFVLYSCFSTRFRDTFRRVFLNCGDNPGGGGGAGGVGANQSWAATGRSAEPSPAASPQVSPRRQAQLKAASAAVEAAPNSRYLQVPLAAAGEDGGTAGSSA